VALSRSLAVRRHASTNAPTVEIDGVTAVPFTEFAAEWRFDFTNSQGASVGSYSTNIFLRADGGPTPFRILVPTPFAVPAGERLHISAQGTIQRMTAFSRGAGRWYQLSNNN
jgi:hypothetical protein